jgi:hypothetical protein
MLGRQATSGPQTREEDEDRQPLLNELEEGSGKEVFSTNEHGEVELETEASAGGLALTSATASREVGTRIYQSRDSANTRNIQNTNWIHMNWMNIQLRF